jgi:hypothetical protein
VSLIDVFRRGSGQSEQRFSFSDWAQDMLIFGGHQYQLNTGYTTTYGQEKAEPIGNGFVDYVRNGLQANGIVAAVESIRTSVFAEARFQWQDMSSGRPGRLFGTPELEILERPWVGGTTGDMLARMMLDAGYAGNSYYARIDRQMVRLRPDWVDIILADRMVPYGVKSEDVHVGMERVGYMYYEGGKGGKGKPAFFLPDEVCHFAPTPDPLATYRGMSWLTPVIREVQADGQATKHKLKFFENAATPNLAVSLPKEIKSQQFREFIELMESKHAGAENAYKTLYTGGGADVTVVGADMKQLDFKTTQGAGETRIAAAGRIHPVLVGLSEGMQGSSLNAGNYNSAKRSTADMFFRPAWRNVSGSLEVLLKPPPKSRLCADTRDIAFLREDERDAAEIQSILASTIRQLTDAGYTPESVIAATEADDRSLLKHSGLYSVQLQKPGATGQPATTTAPVA